MTADPTESAVLAKTPTGLFIAGEWTEAEGGTRFDVVDPATGEALCTVADASAADGARALDAAAEAQADWARTPPRERGEILRRAFDLVTERADDFALVMTLEMGKPLVESHGEVSYGAEFLRWFSEEAVRIGGSYTTAPDGRNRLLTLKRPVGPSLMITPWNFPLAMVTRKVGPAVAAGCTMVLKPSELTPLTALLFTEVMREAGLPAGVLNVIPTTDAPGVTGPLIADERLRKLSFTGSTAVGKALIAASAQNVLRVSMELGGNALHRVRRRRSGRRDRRALAAKLRNGGQACVATTASSSVGCGRVHHQTGRSHGRYAVGRGTEAGTRLGPLINPAAVAKVEARDGRRRVGRFRRHWRLVAGSRQLLLQPTVLAGVSASSAISAKRSSARSRQ